jgi:hypothetical protein
VLEFFDNQLFHYLNPEQFVFQVDLLYDYLMQMDHFLIEKVFDQDLFYYPQIFLQIKQIQYRDLRHVNPKNEFEKFQDKFWFPFSKSTHKTETSIWKKCICKTM